ncbi:hypothetical protein pdam_00014015 [Pocillopora damicornis]|uniref:ETS domain-containing protein n=1 Tax=Pocillopora damicornis TaxID=46731 RepID=A0A3M6V0Q6_POCDA|nr:hypothetical protein pdam_00014015 [Pocillopora damicornis]
MDSESGEPRYKNIVHLWEFLYELLASGDKCSSIIAWIREEHGEFKLKNKEEVAKRWGAYKKIKGMNYEKLSRALRHYYPKGIIKKVAGQRLVYKFNKLPYKYEPGVTRSLYHGSRIKACIQEPTKSKEADPTPPKTNTNTSLSAFTPVRGHPKKSWSWPLLSTPTNPFVLYPGSTPNTPAIFDSSKTMIVFPFGPSPPVHHPLQLHLKREHDKPVGKMITSEVTSIPVSVIQLRGHPKKSWSWPLLSTPSNPFVLYPGSTPNSSKTMIVFPFGPSPPVHHTLPLHLKREHDEPVGKMITAEVTAIPVSIFQRV